MSSTSTPEFPAPVATALSILQHFGCYFHPSTPPAVEPVTPSCSSSSSSSSQHASALENGGKPEDCTCCNDTHRTRGRKLVQWLRKNKDTIALVFLVLCVGMAFALVVHVHSLEGEEPGWGNVTVDESRLDEGEV